MVFTVLEKGKRPRKYCVECRAYHAVADCPRLKRQRRAMERRKAEIKAVYEAINVQRRGETA